MGTSRTNLRGRSALAAALACLVTLALSAWTPLSALAAPGAQSSRGDAAASSASEESAAPASEDADDENTLTDTAGNVFSASRLDGSDNGESTGVLELTTHADNDFLWAGYALELADSSAAGDILAAGRTVTLRDSTADGSVRAAAQGITLSNVTAGRNATLAAQNVYVNGGTTIGGAAYLAAANVKFAGSAKSLFAVADSVTISGTVDGDAYVYANSVRVDEGAVITGTLYVESDNDPSIAGSAQIGTTDVNVTSADAVTDITEPSLTDTIFGYVIAAVGTAAVALLLALVLPGATCGGARMLRTRAGYVILSGILGTLLVLPVVAVLLVFVVTIQASLALLAALGAIVLVCEPLVAAALTGALFPRMNRFAAALVGGLVWGAALCAPYACVILAAVSLVLGIGLAVQAVWLQLRRWRGVRAGGETAGDDSAPASGTLPEASASGQAQPQPPVGENAAPQGAAPAQAPADDGRPVPPPTA